MRKPPDTATENDSDSQSCQLGRGPLGMISRRARPHRSAGDETLKGKKIGVLATDGTDAGLLASLKKMAEAEGAMIEIVAPARGGFTASDGKKMDADHALSGGPSVLFDAVVLAPSEAGVKKLSSEMAAHAWVHDAFGHLKVIGYVKAAKPLLDKGHVIMDEGVVSVDDDGLDPFAAAAKKHRVWDREPKVTSPG